MYYVIDEVACDKCGLWENSTSGALRKAGIFGRGSGRNGLFILGDFLYTDDIRLGMPFAGKSGELLGSVLREVGINEHDSYITNVLKCRGMAKISVDQTRFCLDNNKHDTPKEAPRLLVLLGLTALKTVTGLQKITDRRGILFDAEWQGQKVKVVTTYHPNAVLRQPKLYDVFKEDFRKVRDYLENVNYQDLPEIRKEYINSESRFFHWMHYLRDHPEIEITVDLETTGLSFKKDKIICMALVFEGPDGIVGITFLTAPKVGWWHADFGNSKIMELLVDVFYGRKAVFQNGDFDTKMLWSHGIYVENGFDTLDAHLLIDENLPHGLKFLVTQYLPSEAGYQHKINDQIGTKGAYNSLPTEGLLDYNLCDTFHTHVLS